MFSCCIITFTDSPSRYRATVDLDLDVFFAKGLPNLTPRFMAAILPAEVLSTSKSLSNSANEANTFITSLPEAVEASMLSLIDINAILWLESQEKRFQA